MREKLLNEVNSAKGGLILNKLGDAGVIELADLLKTDTSITLLGLVENKISDTGAKALAGILNSNTAIRTLCLNGNQIGDEGAKALAQALKTYTSIRNLYLKENQIGETGIIALAEAFKMNTGITDISLHGNRIGDAGLIALVEVVKTHSSITSLALCESQIGDVGVIALADVLKTNTHITFLDLLRNPIGDVGVIALADALNTNTCMNYFNLGIDKISNTGLVALRDALKINTGITHLCLHGSNDASIMTLADAFKINTSIEALNLNKNEMGDAGLIALAEAFKTNTNIWFIDWGIDRYRLPYRLGEPGKKALKKLDLLLRRNNGYGNRYRWINQCLKEVTEKLSEETIDFKKITELLNTALEVATILCNAQPPYARAKALLHQVYCQTIHVYAAAEDYPSLIQLYLDHFVAYPDDAISLKLVNILMGIRTEKLSADLSEDDKRQLILLLLTGNQMEGADVIRSRIFHSLTGGKGLSMDEFTKIARVDKVITFAQLTELTEKLKVEPAFKNALLTEINKEDKIVAVYEQLVMRPSAAPTQVKFNVEKNTLNIDNFAEYARAALDTKNQLLIRLGSFPVELLVFDGKSDLTTPIVASSENNEALGFSHTQLFNQDGQRQPPSNLATENQEGSKPNRRVV